MLTARRCGQTLHRYFNRLGQSPVPFGCDRISHQRVVTLINGNGRPCPPHRVAEVAFANLKGRDADSWSVSPTSGRNGATGFVHNLIALRRPRTELSCTSA